MATVATRLADPARQTPILLRMLNAAHVPYQHVFHSNEVMLDCPDCGKEKHLYVNLVKRLGHCQRCKENFSFERLIRDLNLPKRFELDAAPKVRDLRAMTTEVGQRSADGLLPGELPPHCHPAWKFPEAIEFIEKRGLSIREALTFQLRYCPTGPYARRVVFPVVWGNQLVGFQARTIGKEEPKYRFPRGFPSARVLYPQAYLTMGRVILVEGVIPALMYQGLATFGKKLSEKQLLCLADQKRYIRQIVLAWDRDAWDTPGRSKVSPARAAWEKLRECYPTAGLILPAEKPQPDHFARHLFQKLVDRAFRSKYGNRSSIWEVSVSGAMERVL